MSAVKRILVVDPDTGEKSVRVSFDFTQAWDEATHAEFREFLTRKGVDARLHRARGLLAEIADTPEHDAAKEALDRGESVSPNHPGAERAWYEFCALYEHAKRRIVGRKAKATSRAGGEAKAAKDAKKHKRIVADYRKRVKRGDAPRTLAGILAKKHRLTSRQIRTILKKAEVC